MTLTRCYIKNNIFYALLFSSWVPKGHSIITLSFRKHLSLESKLMFKQQIAKICERNTGHHWKIQHFSLILYEILDVNCQVMYNLGGVKCMFIIVWYCRNTPAGFSANTVQKTPWLTAYWLHLNQSNIKESSDIAVESMSPLLLHVVCRLVVGSSYYIGFGTYDTIITRPVMSLFFLVWLWFR